MIIYVIRREDDKYFTPVGTWSSFSRSRVFKTQKMADKTLKRLAANDKLHNKTALVEAINLQLCHIYDANSSDIAKLRNITNYKVALNFQGKGYMTNKINSRVLSKDIIEAFSDIENENIVIFPNIDDAISYFMVTHSIIGMKKNRIIADLVAKNFAKSEVEANLMYEEFMYDFKRDNLQICLLK